MGNRFTKKAIVVGGSTADLFPAPINAIRAPVTSDTNYEIGQKWIFNNDEYTHMGGGLWDLGGVGPASTTVAGVVRLATIGETTAGVATDIATTPAGVAAVAIAGAPLWSEVTAGIVERATTAEAQAGVLDTVGMSPLKTVQLLATPPAIGATTPAAGTFTALTADGTGAVSLGANAASNLSITGAFDLTLASSAGSVIVNAGEAVADAIDLNATSGGLDVDVALLAAITSTRNNAQAILLESTAGGIDILASGSGGAGEDIDIVCTGGSVNISGTENVADAVTIAAANGGIDITCGGAAGEDIDIVNTAGSILINAGEAVSDAINIDSSGGVDLDAVGQINLRSTQSAVDSIVIESTVGGIDILASGAAAGEDIDIIATGSSVNIESTENAALAVYLHANGGVSETIRLRADQGTGAASVDILSDVGGITLTAGLGTADAINLATTDAAGGIDIDSGTSGTIMDSTGAISLDAAAASNFSVSGAGIDLTLASAAGQVIINGEEAAANAVRILSAAGGLDTNVALQMNLDSSQAAVDAVRIIASNAAGGFDFDCGTGGATLDSTGLISIDSAATSNFTVTGAGADLNLLSSGGSVLVESTENAALAVYLHANGGVSETIRLHADQGTGVGSVNLLSDVGGITLTATGLASADAINLEATAGGIDMDSALLTSITSTRNNAQAILLEATAGGIDILASGAAAGEDIDVIATGSSVNIQATEAVSNAITINASDAAGGVVITAGTGKTTVNSNLALATAATQLQVEGGAVTDFIGTSVLTAGTVTIANTNIAATDRIFISRTAVNASTTLGEFTYTISAATSFTVTSVILGTPGSTQTGDVSSFAYFIVRQL